jgi:ABC-type dipeptide/oligopeptide/nickel transport system permease subunit
VSQGTLTVVPVALSGADAQPARRDVLRPLLRQPAAVVSLLLLLMLVVSAVFSTQLFGSPTAVDVNNILSGPSGAHWLGTDELGRDLLARIAYAGRLSLGLGFGATVLSLVVAAAWGLAAASFGGWADEILMRIADAALAIPAILFALVCVGAFGANIVSLTVIIGLLMSPLSARVMRAAVLAELRTDYVRGLTAVGMTRARMLWREVLPNALPALMAQATLNVATAIMLEATLSFLGLGVQPPSASWGTLVADGYSQLVQAPWYPIFPACAILIAIACLQVLGASLQKVLDGGGGS